MATDPDFVFKGFLAAVIGILVTMTLFFSVGIPTEKSMTIFEDGTIFDIDPKWESYEGASRMISIMYVAMMSPAIVGLGILFLTILRRQRRDVEEDIPIQQPGMY